MPDDQKKPLTNLEYLDGAVRLAIGNLGSKLNRGRIPTPADARALKLLRAVLTERADEEKAHQLAGPMVRDYIEQVKALCYAIVDDTELDLGLDDAAVARYRNALTERLETLAGE